MIRYLIRCFFLLCVCTFLQNVVEGQSPQSNYDILKQRLLVISTANFIYTESQGQIDRDSANLFACRMYKFNRLLPYNEGFCDGVISPTSKLIDAGKIGVITNLLKYTEGTNKMRILQELGAYYLFKPGSEKADMDSALFFIQQADTWPGESLSLLGKYYYQAGNIAESQKCFSKVVALGGEPASLALAYENQGKHLPDHDPKKAGYLERSLALYHQLQMKEKEIEIRMYLAEANRPLAEKQWLQILALQKAIGYRHTLYTTHALSRLADMKADHAAALSYARQAIDNMQETGDSTLACLFYTRMGNVYDHLNKPEEALDWYQRSYSGYSGKQDLWYKGFISAANLLAYLGRAEEALSLMQEVTASFPPSNTFDKMRLAFIKGYSYEHLKDNTLAAINYDTFTSMAEKFPLPSGYTETPEAFYQVSLFYFNQGQMAKARTYLQKALDYTSGSMTGIQNLAGIHLLYSKLDSAAGRYASALQYRIKYTFYRDSLLSNQMQELKVEYETAKKDQDIQLRTQSGQLQQAAMQQSGFLRNIILGALLAVLVIGGLFYNQYRLKQVANKKNTDLQHLVHEKESLLKEAHHRIKNNLQTIVNVLESQSTVQDRQNRAYAMSLIHRTSANAAFVNIRSYMTDLVNHLRESFDVSRQIHIHLHIPSLELDVSQAVPVTLIINEAISNSIKYAFPRKEIGQEITVCMERGDDNEITLTISDNGIGLPPDTENGIGLQLMNGLVEDINGTFAITSAEGTLVTIHFLANTPLHKAHHAV